MPDDDEAAEFYRAEFVALRAEIERRANSQQAILLLQVTAVGAVGTVAAQGGDTALTPLVLPFVSLALALLYVDHHQQIRRIGHYILATWDARLPTHVTWEAAWRRQHRRSSDDQLWWAPPWVIFFGTSAGGLLWSSISISNASTSIRVVLLATWGVALGAAGLTAWRLYDGFTRDASRGPRRVEAPDHAGAAPAPKDAGRRRAASQRPRRPGTTS